MTAGPSAALVSVVALVATIAVLGERPTMIEGLITPGMMTVLVVRPAHAR